MNIDEMPAGPELDRLVAEQVMGWEEVMIPCDDQMPVDDGNPLVRYYEKPGETEPICWTEFSPSTDIAHAFEVVEHMTQTTKETWEFHSTTTLHTAIFEFDGGRDRPWKPGQYVGDALSMSLAICIAALKAVDHP